MTSIEVPEGRGVHWWNKLTTEQRKTVTYPLLYAGGSNLKIAAELHVTIGVIAGKRNQWNADGCPATYDPDAKAVETIATPELAADSDSMSPRLRGDHQVPGSPRFLGDLSGPHSTPSTRLRDEPALQRPQGESRFSKRRDQLDTLVHLLKGGRLVERPFERLPDGKRTQIKEQAADFLAWKELRGELRF